MKIGNIRCKHCNIKYQFQYSGQYQLNSPKKFQDDKYCPICKSAIVDALSRVPKKFERVMIETDEVDINTLLDWRDNRLNSNTTGILPVSERVFSTLYNVETGRSKTIYEIYGEGDFKGRIYNLSYYADDMSEIKILVAKEKDLIKNKIIEYWV